MATRAASATKRRAKTRASGRAPGRPAEYHDLTKHTVLLLEPHRRALTARGRNWSELVRAAVIVCYGSPADLVAVPAEYQRAIALQVELAAQLTSSPGPKRRRRRGVRAKGTAKSTGRARGGSPKRRRTTRKAGRGRRTVARAARKER